MCAPPGDKSTPHDSRPSHALFERRDVRDVMPAVPLIHPQLLVQSDHSKFRMPERARKSGRRECRRSGYRNRERSAEHTTELQSRRDLVCRLLLEKKKMTVK